MSISFPMTVKLAVYSILGYWDIGILGYSDIGIFGYWDIRILGYSAIWIFGYLDIHILGYSHIGILYPAKKVLVMQIKNFRVVQPSICPSFRLSIRPFISLRFSYEIDII